MTTDERKIVEVLTEHRPTNNAWEGPIQAAGKSMPGWDSATAKSLVEDMVRRGLVTIKSKSRNRNDAEDDEQSWWELGDVIVASYKGIAIETAVQFLKEALKAPEELGPGQSGVDPDFETTS